VSRRGENKGSGGGNASRWTHLLAQVRAATPQVLVHLGREVAGHVGGGEVADGAEGETDDELVGVVEVVLERVRGEHEHVRFFGEEEHEPEVTDALLGEVGGGDELEALELAEVRRVAEHVHEEELGDVAVAELGQKKEVCVRYVGLGL